MKFKRPKLKFKVLSIEESVEDIYQFLDNEESLNSFTSKNIMNYFNISKNDVLNNGKNIIREVVTQEYDEVCLQKIFNKYNILWSSMSDDILKVLAQIFNVDYIDEDEYTVCISINPVCPRYIEDRRFNCFYKMGDSEVIQNIIHELIHYYWFSLWNTNISNLTHEDMNYPSSIWIWSEIAVDSIFTQSEMKKYLCNDKPAYNYFYEIKYNGDNLIKKLRQVYRSSKNILEFVTRGYDIINNPKLLSILIQ